MVYWIVSRIGGGTSGAFLPRISTFTLYQGVNRQIYSHYFFLETGVIQRLFRTEQLAIWRHEMSSWLC